MSQNDFNIANQGFPSFRSDLNSALLALGSNSSGATAPATTYAYQWWYDTANNILKMRNANNDAWIDFAFLNQTTDELIPTIAGTEITATAAELNNLDGFTGSTDNLNATQFLSGRNLIINGSGRINQRGYVSATATGGANEYTLDRWRVVASGQNLTYTGTNAGVTMTAPAGGVEQVIEGANIVGGTYVISFTGTATCTVGGVTKSSGDTVTLTANTNATVRFSSGTFTDVQLEAGSVATPFERRPVGTELALCQRYYEVGGGHGVSYGLSASAVQRGQVYYRVSKRATATLGLTKTGGVATGPVITNIFPSLDGFSFGFSSTAASQEIVITYTADAEL